VDLLILCHFGLYQDLSASFVHAQAKAFASLGHRVRVIIPIAYGKRNANGSRFFPKYTVSKVDGVELCYVRYLSLSGYGEKNWNVNRATKAICRKLRKITCDFTPEVLYAHTLGFDSRVGATIKSRLGCPLIVTSHGSDSSIPFENGNLDELRQWCDQADKVVAVSSALAEKIKKSGTKTQLDVILNGFRTEHLPQTEKKEPKSFVQVGHLTDQKRVNVTIKAFAEVAKNNPDARLTIIGNGLKKEELENLCHSLNVEDKVTFTGHIPNERVLKYLSQSQFFVMPSVREGFGIVYIEAMACGCVTIGTEGEGIADVIHHGENGFLVKADSPDEITSIIENCIENPDTMERVAKAGIKDAKNLTWENNAQKYIDLFQGLK